MSEQITFGKKLEWYRESLKLTYEEMANRYNMELGWYLRLEDGRGKPADTVLSDMRLLLEVQEYEFGQIKNNVQKSQQSHQQLVDVLRKSLLYQVPSVGQDASGNTLAGVTLYTNLYQQVMRLIYEAGGWDLSQNQKQTAVNEFIKQVRKDDGSFDLSDRSVIELSMVLMMLECLPNYEQHEDYKVFAEAVRDALK